MPLSASACVAMIAPVQPPDLKQTRHELEPAADILGFAAGAGSVIEIQGLTP
jgi:hypothetical protein